jgi:hypothetical protein
MAHLGKDAFGDVVVATPVRRALGKGELVHVVATALAREALRFAIDRARVAYLVALAAQRLDRGDLFGGRAGRDHGHERQAEHAREIGFRHGGGAGRGLDYGGAFADPPAAQRMEEQRARQTVLEAAGGVAALVLEIDRDARQRGQIERDEVGIGAARVVRLDPRDGPIGPAATAAWPGRP